MTDEKNAAATAAHCSCIGCNAEVAIANEVGVVDGITQCGDCFMAGCDDVERCRVEEQGWDVIRECLTFIETECSIGEEAEAALARIRQAFERLSDRYEVLK